RANPPGEQAVSLPRQWACTGCGGVVMFHFRSWLRLMAHRREASRRDHATRRKRKFRLTPPFRPFLERLESWILPSTFTVTNTNDSGPGSLRQAILNANIEGGSGPLYIANAGNNTLTVVDPLGNASTFANTGLSNPEGVAVDTAGNVYVANVFT